MGPLGSIRSELPNYSTHGHSPGGSGWLGGGGDERKVDRTLENALLHAVAGRFSFQSRSRLCQEHKLLRYDCSAGTAQCHDIADIRPTTNHRVSGAYLCLVS